MARQQQPVQQQPVRQRPVASTMKKGVTKPVAAARQAGQRTAGKVSQVAANAKAKLSARQGVRTPPVSRQRAGAPATRTPVQRVANATKNVAAKAATATRKVAQSVKPAAQRMAAASKSVTKKATAAVRGPAKKTASVQQRPAPKTVQKTATRTAPKPNAMAKLSSGQRKQAIAAAKPLTRSGVTHKSSMAAKKPATKPHTVKQPIAPNQINLERLKATRKSIAPTSQRIQATRKSAVNTAQKKSAQAPRPSVANRLATKPPVAAQRQQQVQRQAQSKSR